MDARELNALSLEELEAYVAENNVSLVIEQGEITSVENNC